MSNRSGSWTTGSDEGRDLRGPSLVQMVLRQCRIEGVRVCKEVTVLPVELSLDIKLEDPLPSLVPFSFLLWRVQKKVGGIYIRKGLRVEPLILHRLTLNYILCRFGRYVDDQGLCGFNSRLEREWSLRQVTPDLRQDLKPQQVGETVEGLRQISDEPVEYSRLKTRVTSMLLDGDPYVQRVWTERSDCWWRPGLRVPGCRGFGVFRGRRHGS